MKLILAFGLVFLIALNTCSASLKFPDYKEHPCKRQCDGKVMKCEYDFTLEWIYSMERNCQDCLKNVTSDCFNANCIVADGRNRMLNVINRMLPGPSIEVCKGDQIMVNIINNLGDTTTSMHWHGQHQRGTPFMDGVPLVTQCPIQPLFQFRYDFEATQVGTHFYHSHSGFQRSDGLYGKLVVREPDADNSQRQLYDFDLSEHTIIASEWFIESGKTHYNRKYRLKLEESLMTTSILINEFGSSLDNDVPVPVFSVDKGYKYRFRLVHAGSLSCPLKINVQDHNMTVISADSFDFDPVTVDSIFVGNGERIDFVINADRPVDNYWIKIKGLKLCANTESLAILRYNGAGPIPGKDKSHVKMQDESAFNCLNVPANAPNCHSFVQLSSTDAMDPRLKEEPDFKYHIGIDLHNYNRPVFADFDNVTVQTPALNNLIFNFPPGVLLEEGISSMRTCNKEDRTVCPNEEGLCECAHLVEIPFNSTVELIIIDEGLLGQNMHPMHLHGYAFRVVGQDKIGDSATVEQIQEMDKLGLLPRNLDNPPLKDTLAPTDGGYTILRFVADNPGYWIFHCHLEFHMDGGMALVFKTGEPVRPPKNFPKCGNF